MKSDVGKMVSDPEQIYSRRKSAIPGTIPNMGRRKSMPLAAQSSYLKKLMGRQDMLSVETENGSIPSRAFGLGGINEGFMSMEDDVDSQVVISPGPVIQMRRKSMKPGSIHDAIRTGNTPLLQDLLSHPDCKVEELDGSTMGRRPLHIAAEVNNLTAATLLIKRRADPLATQNSFYGLTPIHVAAEYGSLEVLTFLLTQVNPYNNVNLVAITDKQGSTPLHWAVQRHQMESARLLLQHGAAVDCKQTQGLQSTPVHTACSQGSLVILKLMADMSPVGFRRTLTDPELVDTDGSMPLHKAALLDLPALMDFLVKKVRTVHRELMEEEAEVPMTPFRKTLRSISSGYTLDEDTCKRGELLDVFDIDGHTPLHLAASRGAWKNVTVLMKAGADPFAHGPVHWCRMAHHSAQAGENIAECTIFVTLLRNNPHLVPSLDAADDKGYTAIHYAAISGNVMAVKGLMQLGANIRVRNRKEKTVLHYAAKHGHFDIVEVIMRTSDAADILNCVDWQGRTAYHLAATHGHQDIVEYLISKGASAVADDFGKAPLHLAAAQDHLAVLGTIVSNHGSMLNNVDQEGYTALHHAAFKDSARAVAFLLANGAINKMENTGKTALELAIGQKNESAALAFVNSARWKDFVSMSSVEYGTIALGLIQQLPDVMKVCLDRCVKKRRDEKTGEPYATYDFSLLEKAEVSAIMDKDKPWTMPMWTFKVMSKLKRTDLLLHPVTKTLLERKWIIYGLYCSALILISNSIFVTLLSLVTVYSVERELRPHLFKIILDNVGRHHPDALNDSDWNEIKRVVKEDEEAGHPGFEGTPLAVPLVIALMVVAGKELADAASEGWGYFRDWTNYFQISLFVSNTGFMVCLAIDNFNGSVGDLTFQFGAVAVFLAWFNLLRFFRPFGTFGIYSVMFFTIFRTLLQVALFFFVLMAAFTISFFILFNTFIFPDDPDYYDASDPNDLDPDELQTTHGWLPTSAVRVASLMLGDLEAFERFLVPLIDGMLPFPVLGYIFYSALLIMMPILLVNLLMGLSIGDMASVRRNAVILRIRMQISLHESLEKLFPTRFREKIHNTCSAYRYYPTRKVDFQTWFARLISGSTVPPEVNEVLENDDPEVVMANAERNELLQLRKRLQDMDGNMDEMRQLLVQISNSLDKTLLQEPMKDGDS
ncbi:hypothetical protein RvY_10654 [Ramazzottius varieornatus]|uniref:Ion transport domain-containing protein n=1 Tax=Ramazzottius varieornatus TaxID=947166 RepID=A0A1D1VLA4_RAMVA|nr:hypothetical protein RvY_10654 [Ramazzottius varieornatus]